MSGLLLIYDQENPLNYDQHFLLQIEEYGLLGYSIDEIKEIIEPSCNSEELEKIMREFDNYDSALARLYRNGQVHQKLERDQMLISNDKDSTDAALNIIEIRKEELLAKRINEYYSL